jgi:hypothetical protein
MVSRICNTKTVDESRRANRRPTIFAILGAGMVTVSVSRSKMGPNALPPRELVLVARRCPKHHHHGLSQGDVRHERFEAAGVAKHDVIITVNQVLRPQVTVVDGLDRLPSNGVGYGRARPSKG